MGIQMWLQKGASHIAFVIYLQQPKFGDAI